MANVDSLHSDTQSAPQSRLAAFRASIQSRKHLRGHLNKYEVFWRDNYDWLLARGYQLRPRYQPDWKPSWDGKKKKWFECTDGLQPHHSSIVDAQRTSDGELLLLKRFEKSVYPHEVEIGQFFSSGSLATDPRNHCVPIYDVLQAPGDEDLAIIVMPLLKIYDRPPFDTIGEAVEFFRQIFEGLQFIHQNNVAHRDATHNNIMMDARTLCVHRYHPFRPNKRLDLRGDAKYHTRTSKPVKYYFTDFGLSRKYRMEDRPPLEDIIIGGDKSVPEFETTDTCDPFPTDVYTLGNLIRENFIEGSQFASSKQGFDFMKPLVADMTQTDPSKRPTMDEVVEHFEKVRKDLSPWKLRSRIVYNDDTYLTGLTRAVSHWARRITFVLQRIPALPTPS